MLDFEEFFHLGGDVAHQIKLELLFANEHATRSCIRLLVVIEVMHVNEYTLTLLERSAGSINQCSEVILTLRYPSDLHDLNGDGELNCA